MRGETVNRLLATLPKKEYERLLPDLKRIPLIFGDVLYEPGDIIKHVYFPNDSIVSLLSALSERSTLEVGMVGNDGMAGLPIFMGVNVSRTRALVQGAGSAMRMTSAAVRPGGKPSWRAASTAASLYPLAAHSGISIGCVQPLSYGGRPACPMATDD
jgi:hypothetical protein